MARWFEREIINALFSGDKHQSYRYLTRYSDMVRLFHEKIEQKTCPICGKKFKTIGGLKQHMLRSECGRILIGIIREGKTKDKAYKYIAEHLHEALVV